MKFQIFDVVTIAMTSEEALVTAYLALSNDGKSTFLQLLVIKLDLEELRFLLEVATAKLEVKLEPGEEDDDDDNTEAEEIVCAPEQFENSYADDPKTEAEEGVDGARKHSSGEKDVDNEGDDVVFRHPLGDTSSPPNTGLQNEEQVKFHLWSMKSLPIMLFTQLIQ